MTNATNRTLDVEFVAVVFVFCLFVFIYKYVHVLKWFPQTTDCRQKRSTMCGHIHQKPRILVAEWSFQTASRSLKEQTPGRFLSGTHRRSKSHRPREHNTQRICGGVAHYPDMFLPAFYFTALASVLHTTKPRPGGWHGPLRFWFVLSFQKWLVVHTSVVHRAVTPRWHQPPKILFSVNLDTLSVSSFLDFLDSMNFVDFRVSASPGVWFFFWAQLVCFTRADSPRIGPRCPPCHPHGCRPGASFPKSVFESKTERGEGEREKRKRRILWL